jgi:hypothetical protein
VALSAKWHIASSLRDSAVNSKRFRLRYTFWLDTNKQDEYTLSEYVEYLKENRLFVKTVRDGLRLIADLREGRVDVLLELFPNVRKAFTSSSGGGNNDDVKAAISRVEQILLEQSAGTTYHMGGLKSLTSGIKEDGPKAMNVQKYDLPTFDDEDDLDTLIVKKDTSTDSAQNFLNSLQRLGL